MNFVVITYYRKTAVTYISIFVNDNFIVKSVYFKTTMKYATILKYKFISTSFFDAIFYPFYFRALTDLDVLAKAV